MAILTYESYKNETQVTHNIAENTARANFNKDTAFRLWGTGHGRIYVPITTKYQPDIYLSHIKERDITTPSGIKLTLINPARIVRQLDEEYKYLYGVSGRVVSDVPLRPGNKTDKWEQAGLERLRIGIKEVMEYTKLDGKAVLRLLQPLKTEKGCLFCHKNSTYKVGSITGAIGVILPMEKLLKDLKNRQNILLKQYFLIWFVVVLVGILLFGYYYKQQKKLNQVFDDLILSEQRNRAVTESSLDAVVTIDGAGKIIEMNGTAENMFGYAKAQYLNKDMASLIIPDNLVDAHHNGFNKYLKTGVISILNSRVEVVAKRADQTTFPVELAIAEINVDGTLFFTAHIRDLTKSRELEEKLVFQASHDVLTGLLNRRAFEEHVQVLINQSEINCCLLYLDLDKFKIINDTEGHDAGDLLLKQLASLLRENVEESCTLARIGGDEFAILFKGCDIERAQEKAEKLIELVKSYRLIWKENAYSVGVSIGLVDIQNTKEKEEFLYSEYMSMVDSACFKAKEEGSNRYYVYKFDDDSFIFRKDETRWFKLIHQALDNDEFVIYKQDIYPTNKQHQKHSEVLLRIIKNDGTVILPNEFIPAAERYSLMHLIDKWVVENTLQIISKKKDFFNEFYMININLSAATLSDETFEQFIFKQLEKYQVDAKHICFEITETTAIGNMGKAIKFINDLRAAGCKFALDDFGSGLSSFAYLKTFPVDFVKIDGVFIKDIRENEINLAMVKSINDVAHVMGKKTIAEYVEDEETATLLRVIGVDYIQGCVYSKAHPFV